MHNISLLHITFAVSKYVWCAALMTHTCIIQIVAITYLLDANMAFREQQFPQNTLPHDLQWC